MFCNEIEDTLFSPIPSSLWTDYYNDQEDEDNFFGNGVRRNYPKSSKGRQLLPSLRHFRSLPQMPSCEGVRGDLYAYDDDFSDEMEGSPMASPSSSPQRLHSGRKVKALFNDGCLFAYSPPSKHESGSAFRSRLRRAKGSLSPRSRRHRSEPSLPSQHRKFPGPEFSLPRLGKDREGLR